MHRSTSMLIVTGVIVLVSGCSTLDSLRTSTTSQGATTTDIIYEMVLDNLEMARQSPGALPWHLKLTQGGIGVTDQVSPSLTLAWPNIARTAVAGGSRQWALSWTAVPELKKEKLVALQGLYQQEACRDPSIDNSTRAACEEKFQRKYVEGSAAPANVPSGSYRGVTLAPRSSDLTEFTNFVLDILGSAPVDPAERALTLPASARH